MKLTIFLMTLALMNVYADSRSQTVSYKGQNVPLKNVCQIIEKQTKYLFLFSESALKTSRPVTLSVANMPLEKVLAEIFRSQPLEYSVKGKTIFVTVKPAPEPAPANKGLNGPELLLPIDVRGKVVNENGEPIGGVSVMVKGTKRGTVTNEKGEFELKGVNSGDMLVFSGISVESFERRAGDITELAAITLSTKVIALTDISVKANTGYQTISKERATGAYDVIGRNVLDKRPVSDISTALQGLVAGLQAKENADGSMNFLIRGNSSMYTPGNPLIVVDGFPIASNNFSTINPNDVESVTVLKDAAAASIWGARAANGVIVVTTKQAKMGRDKMTVEVNAFTRISDMIDLDQVMMRASSPDNIHYEKLALDRQLFAGLQYAPAFSRIGASLSLAQELIYANKYDGLPMERVNAGLDSLSKIDNKAQLRDHLLQRGILTQVSVNLSSGTEKTKMYGSILYENKKDGIYKNGYDRYLMNFNTQFQVTKFLQLFAGANLQLKKTENSGAAIGEMDALSPYETLLDPDGSYSVNLKGLNRKLSAQLPLSDFPYSDWSYNLLREVRGRQVRSEQISARIQTGINLRIFKGLYLDSKLQYERTKTDDTDYQSEETHFVRDLVNFFTEYDDATKIVGRKYLPKGGILKSGNLTDESYVWRNQLSYSVELAKEFSVNAIAGNEVSNYLRTGQRNPWVYGYVPDKNQSAIPPYGYGTTMNPLMTYRGWEYTLGDWFYGEPDAAGNTVFTWEKDKYVSFYGNAAISWKDKYVLSGSARSDASNYITDNPRMRWSPLWSIGGMWHIYREKFLLNYPFIDRLSLRLTYGKNGNSDKSTSTKPLLNVSTTPNPHTNTITASILDNGNPTLRWEKTRTINFGVDYSLFRNRLFGKIDLYDKLGSDITGFVALPSTTGTTAQKFNNAAISNRGFEIELGTDLQFGKLQWNTTITYAYNRNRVKSLYYPSVTAYELLEQPAFVEGKPVGAVYSYTFLGMIDSVPNVAGAKGAPYTMNSATLHYTGLGLDFLNYEGTNVPPHTLGFVNSFNLHGFNLMFVFVGKFGGVYRNPYFLPQGVGYGKTVVNKFVADVIAKDPGVPDFPRSRETQYYLWDRYVPWLQGLVQNSSYLECKEINLQYNLPKSICSRIMLSGLRFFAQVRDLGTVWHANDKGFNPDWLPGTPRPVTSYTVGLNAKF